MGSRDAQCAPNKQAQHLLRLTNELKHEGHTLVEERTLDVAYAVKDALQA